MLIRKHPVGDQYPVSQGWGVRPEYYSRYACSGVPLRGHNGVDFAVPVGVPVAAVADGTVMETGNDPTGYGLYVKVRHDWGESLYAHLSQVTVAVGNTVMAGSRLGISGNTGNSTGPHLHFAIRIAPYFRNDGWCGFSDPTYHLNALKTRPLAYLGVQFQGQGLGRYLNDLERLQPQAVLLINPDLTDAANIRQICPHTIIVGRIYRPDSEIQDRIMADPIGAGRWMHQISLENSAVTRGLIDYVQVPNEVCQFWHQLEALRDAELERMRLAEGQGFKCAVLGTSVGNLHMPENDRMAYWRVVYPVLERAEDKGHIVLIHQYGAPDMWGPKEIYGPDASQWLAERWQYQVYPRLPFRNRLKVLVGEFGIDGLLYPSREAIKALGEDAFLDPATDVLQKTPPETDYEANAAPSRGPCGWQCFTDAGDYVHQLITMAEHHERWRGQVVGATIFVAKASSPWETYDISGDVLRRLADYYSGTAPQPPLPLPPQGGNMPEVYDKDGVQRDMNWLRAKYGNVQFLNAGLGPKFRLVRIEETEGPALIKVRVLDNMGRPHAGQPVANHWPDPNLPYLVGQGLQTLWRDRAINQRTDSVGYTGFGLGSGSYISNLQEGGPHVIWVLSPSLRSDGLSGVGMLGGTNHAGPLSLVFQIGEDETPANSLEELLLREGERNQVIQFNPNAALQRAIFAAGFVPNSPEYDVTWQGVSYRAQRAEHLASGEVRIYYCRIGDWGNVRYLTRP